MIIYEWIMTRLLPIFLPQEILDTVVLYVNNHNDTVTGDPLTVGQIIGAGYALLVGFCCAYFLAWVPFRGILRLINWSKWRGYGRRR